VLLGAGALVLAAAPFLPAAVPEEIQQVLVTNFPSVQQVEGSVTVGAPVPQAALAAVADVLVAPGSREDVNHLVPGGVVRTDGFGQAVLSLTGQTRGEILRAGAVGAFLVPDEEPILRVLEEKGILQFPIEVAVPAVSAATPYFASPQPKVTLAFPRYRVFFYNTCDKSVSVTLYAYLTG
jgi:hypothetical protein